MSGVHLQFNEGMDFEEFQKLFSGAFPKLRIRIHYEKGSKEHEKSGDVLEMTENTTVEELETAFSEQFLIAATFYRLTGSNWMAVKQTRHWSLKEQNEEGEELSH
jgi:hypothetical protein